MFKLNIFYFINFFISYSNFLENEYKKKVENYIISKNIKNQYIKYNSSYEDNSISCKDNYIFYKEKIFSYKEKK